MFKWLQIKWCICLLSPDNLLQTSWPSLAVRRPVWVLIAPMFLPFLRGRLAAHICLVSSRPAGWGRHCPCSRGICRASLWLLFAPWDHWQGGVMFESDVVWWLVPLGHFWWLAGKASPATGRQSWGSQCPGSRKLLHFNALLETWVLFPGAPHSPAAQHTKVFWVKRERGKSSL